MIGDNPGQGITPGQDDIALSKQMISNWTQFSKTGSPLWNQVDRKSTQDNRIYFENAKGQEVRKLNENSEEKNNFNGKLKLFKILISNRMNLLYTNFNL